MRHGNPAGFDSSAGESSVDVARKVMRSEIVKHILDECFLNADGSLHAHDNVLYEANQKDKIVQASFGQEAATKNANFGAVSLKDWKLVQGGKVKYKTNPPRYHINLGIPNEKMTTCRNIQHQLAHFSGVVGFP